MSPSARPATFWLSLVSLLLFALWFAWQGLAGIRVETSLLDLLPQEDRRNGELAAIRQFADNASAELLYLVSTRDPERTRAAAAAFANTLRASAAFARVEFTVDSRALDQLQSELGRRAVLLSDRHRDWLRQGNVARIEREAQQSAYTPLGLARPFKLADDPLGLAADMLNIPGIMGAAALEDDYLSVRDGERIHALIRAQVRGSPYALPVQQQALASIDAAKAAAQKIDNGVTTLGSGVLLHAAEGARRARSEVTWFGLAGTFGIVVLLIVVFRSPWPLLLTLAILAIATAASVAICQAVFGKVHILTLTFGTSLIGVAVDYVIHHFTHVLEVPARPARELIPALLLGCGTTVAGYLALLVAPIAALRQIALYSATGLAIVCLTVLLVLPHIKVGLRAPIPRWAYWLHEHVVTGWPRILLLACAVLATSIGLLRTATRDDLRALQQPSTARVAADQEVRRLLQTGFDTRFVLVVAPTENDVLLREEALRLRLAPLLRSGTLTGYLAVTQSLPSLARQAENRQLMAKYVLGHEGALARVLTSLGFPAADTARRVADFQHAQQQDYRPQDWLASPASELRRRLWLQLPSGEHASIVLLRGLQDDAALRTALRALPGVSFVDQVEEIDALLRHYRETTSTILLVVAAIIVLALLLRYRAGDALVTAMPAVGGVVLTLGLLGLLHQPLNLFNTLALLLVLGMGVDYAVFLREGARPATMLAIALCSLTTLLSFGLLGFSSVPFVSSIGQTVAMGIGSALALTLLLRRRPEA